MTVRTKRAAIFIAALAASAPGAALAQSASPYALMAQNDTVDCVADPAKCLDKVLPKREAEPAAEEKSQPEAKTEAEVKADAEVETKAEAAEPAPDEQRKPRDEKRSRGDDKQASPGSKPASEPVQAAPAAEPAREEQRQAEPSREERRDDAKRGEARDERRDDNKRRDTRDERRDDNKRRDARDERRDDNRNDARDDRRDDNRRRDARDERRNDDRRREERRRDARNGKQDGALEFSLPIPGVDGRVVIRQDGKVTVKSEDDRRFSRDRNDRHVTQLPNGRTRTVVDRPNGVRITTVRAKDGTILRRVREAPNGQRTVLIDSERTYERHGGRDHRQLRFDRPLDIRIPRDRYIVDSDRARPDDIEAALSAKPVEQVERAYTLGEIRGNERLRSKLRRVDLTLTFAFDSAAIPRDQVDEMDKIGRILQRAIEQNPSEVFLIEGHTDAPGSDEYNLRLSDARAESLAIALSDYYDIPPENLVTQGYGEDYLKIPTEEREPRNRRVTVRRITPLLRGDS